jgi:hypothetical protein
MSGLDTVRNLALERASVCLQGRMEIVEDLRNGKWGGSWRRTLKIWRWGRQDGGDQETRRIRPQKPSVTQSCTDTTSNERIFTTYQTYYGILRASMVHI